MRSRPIKSVGLAALLAVGGCAADRIGSSPPVCTSGGVVKFARKADLPPEAAAALGAPMADVGEAFNAGDTAIAAGPLRTPPSARFIDAVQRGCRLVVHYEQGGIGYSHGETVLRQTAKGWLVERERTIPVS